MDQSFRVGKLLTKIPESWRILAILIISRLVVLLGTYFLIGSFKEWSTFKDFLLVFGRRWDGNSYTFLAKHWYVTQGSEAAFIVFPPLYPLVIKVFNLLTNNYVLAGVVASNLFFVLGGCIFYQLLKLDYSNSFSLKIILVIAFFPTAYFFSLAYPEALFFCLLSWSFLLIRKGQNIASFLAAALATLTRPFGIVIWPALALVIINSKKRLLPKLVMMTFIAASAVLIYLAINYGYYHDPLAFTKILNTNWQKHFTFPWIGIINSWKRGLFTPDWTDYKIHVGLVEAIVSTFAWILIPFGLWGKRKLKLPYLLFYSLGVIFFTSTDFILSAPRYLLSLPPFFIILTKGLTNKIALITWLTISTGLLFYYSTTIATGRWAF